MRVFPITFALSVAINAAALFSVEHVAKVERVHLLKELDAQKGQKEGDLQFEFVESPQAAPASRPESAKKISIRDTAAQDTTLDKSRSQELPKTKTLGPADQLQQVRGKGGQPIPPTPIQKPAPERRVQAAQEPKPASTLGSEEVVIAPPQKDSQGVAAISPEAPNPVAAPQDKITTQEMSRVESAGAKLYGLTSFEATGSGMGEYMKGMKEKIWLAWFPYISFKYPQDFKGARAVISFTLNKNGEVKLIRIVESQGTPVFAAFCMEAIQRAGNFGRLSDEILALIGKDELEIRFGFHYR